MKDTKQTPNQKQIRQQLYRMADLDYLSINFISAVAGDRGLTPSEKKIYQKLRKQRGELIYVDFLFLLTHQYYPKETAELIWKQIIEHKKKWVKKSG